MAVGDLSVTPLDLPKPLAPAVVGMGGPPRHPPPFQEFVIKVHGQCDLACDYCYMYQLADRTSGPQLAAMTVRTFEKVVDRIRDHARTHQLPRARVVLHGGEPILVGAARLAQMSRRLRDSLCPATDLDITVQTNGVRCGHRELAALSAEGIRVGVSLDGDRHANDRHRRFASQRSSFDAVDAALRLLRDRPDSFAGILCVVDLVNSPKQTYEALLQYRPPRIDFLLPLANWTHPPPGHTGTAPYGRWLSAAFDRWYDAPVRETGVRLFEEVIHLWLGGGSRVESIGQTPSAAIVFGVDGSYEDIDTLRSAYAGAVDTGRTVFDSSLDEISQHPDLVARRRGEFAMVCRSCPVRRVCGGGYLPHRWRSGAGFDNPSVYCADLSYFIRHVRSRLQADIAGLRGRRQCVSTG